MDSKQQKLIDKIVLKHGYIKASEILGIDILELAKHSHTPIESLQEAKILLDSLLQNHKITNVYKHSTIYLDEYDSYYYWNTSFKLDDNRRMELISLCTPLLEDQAIIPVQPDYLSIRSLDTNTVSEYDLGDIGFYEVIKTRSSFDNLNDLIHWYKNFYLIRVNNMIMDKFSLAMQDIESGKIKPVKKRRH